MFFFLFNIEIKIFRDLSVIFSDFKVKMDAKMVAKIFEQFLGTQGISLDPKSEKGKTVVPCRWGDNCTNGGCTFGHSAGAGKTVVPCRFGDDCRNKDACSFGHSAGKPVAQKSAKIDYLSPYLNQMEEEREALFTRLGTKDLGERKFIMQRLAALDEAIAKVEAKAPAKVDAKAPAKVEAKAPAKAPAKVEAKAPAKVEAKAPAPARPPPPQTAAEKKNADLKRQLAEAQLKAENAKLEAQLAALNLA